MKITKELQKTLQSIITQNYPAIPGIVDAITQAGGRVLLVGGAVRDLFLGLRIKDLDIEVHGLSIDQLEELLKQFGPVRLVGKQFGVLRIDGIDADWSLPRKDSKGRKPEVVIDPDMSVEDAFRRRDLTINAMGIDMGTHELLDPFDGQKDLKNKTLRAVDEKLFLEDPLRFYRVMQFMARFGMQPDKQLNEICKQMDLSTVSIERIEGEFEKMLLKSERPSVGIRWLAEIGRLNELFPEIAALINVPQRDDYHPEGDVFEHTMQSLDAAAMLAKDLPKKDRLILLYAALCHDLGKPETTEEIEGVIKSLGHAEAGVPLTEKLLKRITRNKELTDSVKKLVKYHMVPISLISNNAKPAAYKRLARKLEPETNIAMLVLVAKADRLGRILRYNSSGITQDERGPKQKELLKEIDEFIARAKDAMVEHKAEEPVLHGRDIMDLVDPGPKMGELLKKAYEIQIDEGITDKNTLKERITFLIDNV